MNEISAEDITISFICSQYPREVMRHLKNIRKYCIEKLEKAVSEAVAEAVAEKDAYIKELESRLALQN